MFRLPRLRLPSRRKTHKTEEVFTKRISQTHDFTVSRWGRAVGTWDTDDGGVTARITGWGRGVKQGDYILLSHNNGDPTRYRVERIEYYNDPPDMWRAEVRFAPRFTPAA